MVTVTKDEIIKEYRAAKIAASRQSRHAASAACAITAWTATIINLRKEGGR